MDICYVVNAVSTTSIPADIAVRLNERDCMNVDLVAWFRADPFPGSEQIGVYSLESRNSLFTSLRKFSDMAGQYDIIHTNHNHSGTFAKIVGEVNRTQLVVTENAAHDRFSGIGYYTNGMTTALADALVCVSDAVRESFAWWEKLLAPDTVETIYNGIDLDRINESRSIEWELYDSEDINEDSFVIGHAASMKPVKSQRTLIDAMRSLVNSNIDVELVIAGDGRLRGDLESLVTEYELTDVVHFLGQLPRQKVYKMMDSCDAFAMPSSSEAYCVAVAEAMATETPCIVSDIDVFHEVYGDTPLYHPVNDGKELAARIKHLLHNSEVRDSVARRGYELVTNTYTLEKTVDNYHQLYRSLA